MSVRKMEWIDNEKLDEYLFDTCCSECNYVVCEKDINNFFCPAGELADKSCPFHQAYVKAHKVKEKCEELMWSYFDGVLPVDWGKVFSDD